MKSTRNAQVSRGEQAKKLWTFCSNQNTIMELRFLISTWLSLFYGDVEGDTSSIDTAWDIFTMLGFVDPCLAH